MTPEEFEREAMGDGRAIDTASAYGQINGPRTDVGDTTLFWLDKWGAPRKIRNAQGSETVITRAQGTYPALVTKLRLPSSQVLTATYDARGNIASVADSATVVNDTVALTQYTWDPTWDFVTKIVPPERDSLTFAYDGSTGNRLWQRNALGDTVHFRYNSAGLLRASDGPLTPPDTVIYDEGFHDACVHDRVRVRPERPTHDPQARYRGGAPNGNDTTKYGYDAVGRSDGSSVSRTR